MLLDDTSNDSCQATSRRLPRRLEEAGCEIDVVGVERAEPGAVSIAAIENNDGAGIEAKSAGRLASMHTAFGDHSALMSIRCSGADTVI